MAAQAVADGKCQVALYVYTANNLEGRYRRFVLRQVTLDALLNRVETTRDLPRDESLTETAATLEDAEGQYSYPAIIQAPNGDLNMTYTWQRKTIKYAHFALADVPGK